MSNNVELIPFRAIKCGKKITSDKNRTKYKLFTSQEINVGHDTHPQ